MDHADSQITKILRYAKNASPEGLRAAVRPVVRRVLPEQVRARVRDLERNNSTAADRWVDNHYTIKVDGQKRHFFFVCGGFKSGTHWVQNLLNLHPQVFVQGEYHFEYTKNAIDHLTSVHWFLSSKPELGEIAVDTFEMMVRRMIWEGAREHRGAIWLGDRTPNPLMTTIRGAPLISITRDVRDVLVSWSFHHTRVEHETGIALPFREKWAQARAKFLADPDAFNPLDGLLGDEGWVRHHARHWADVCRRSREAKPKLDELGTRVLELQYEQIHADLEGERGRLYRFLGLDPALAREPSAATKTLPGFKQENRRSFFRKGAVGEWHETLDESLCKIIKEEAGEEMIAAGYEKDLNW